MQLAANLGGGRAAAAAFRSVSLSNPSSSWTNTFPHSLSAAVGPFGAPTAAIAASLPGVTAALLPATTAVSSVPTDAAAATALADQASGSDSFLLQHPPLHQQQRASNYDGSCVSDDKLNALRSTAAAAPTAQSAENSLHVGTQQAVFRDVDIAAAVNNDCTWCSSTAYPRRELQHQQPVETAMLLDDASCSSLLRLQSFLPRYQTALLRQHQLHQQLLAAAAALEVSPYTELNDAAAAQQVLNEARRRSCCPPMDSATAAAAYLLERDEEHQNDLQQRWFDWQQQQLLLQQQLQTQEHAAEQLEEQQPHPCGEHQEQQQQRVDEVAQQQAEKDQQRLDDQQQQQQPHDITQQEHGLSQQQQQDAALLHQQEQHYETDTCNKTATSAARTFSFNPRAMEFVPTRLQGGQRRRSVMSVAAQQEEESTSQTAGVTVARVVAVQMARPPETEPADAATAQTGTASTAPVGPAAGEETSTAERAVAASTEARTAAESEGNAVNKDAGVHAIHPAGDVPRDASESEVSQQQQRQQLLFPKEEDPAASDPCRGDAASLSCLQQRTRQSQATNLSAALCSDRCPDVAVEAATTTSPMRDAAVEAEQQQCPLSAAGDAAVGQQQERQRRQGQEPQEDLQLHEKGQLEEQGNEAEQEEEPEQTKHVEKEQQKVELQPRQLQQKGRKKQHSEDLVLDMALVKQTSLQQQQQELKLQGSRDSRFKGAAAAGWKPAASENQCLNEEEEEAETCTSSNSNSSKGWCPDVPFLSPRGCAATGFLPALRGAAPGDATAQTVRADVTDDCATDRGCVSLSTSPAAFVSDAPVKDDSESKRCL